MIYIAHGFGMTQLENALQPWLRADELRQASGYSSLERQRQYLVGRGLLRWLTCDVTGTAAADVMITRQKNGAPLLTIANKAMTCSISHKNDAVMVAFGDVDALGIDIEQMQQRKRHLDLLENFHEGFMQGVASQDLEAFYQRWTLAESVTKAQQGKLLATLRASFDDYREDAVFHTELGHMLCCYAEASHGIDENNYHWQSVSVSEQQTLRAELLTLTNEQ